MSSIRLVSLVLLTLATSALGDEPTTKGDAKESIHVDVVGKLRTGIFAIGGETTGTTITAKGITWELELGRDAGRRKLADSLDGKLVQVEGSLERRPGVEIRERWIVTVAKLEAAGGEGKTSAVSGKVVVPAGVAAFEGRVLEIKLFEFDPRLADVSATLIDESTANITHAEGEKTETTFGVGTDFEPRPDRSYYITVFVTEKGRRTHIGERDGKRGLTKVLESRETDIVNIVVRPVR